MTRRRKHRRKPPLHTVAAEGEVKLQKLEYARLSVAKLVIAADQEPADDNLVSSIAESLVVTGYIHPVIVRRLGKSKYQVLWGADVVAAAQAAELTRIECQFFEGSDDEARLVQVAEALFRKHLTALEQAEHWADWGDGVLKVKGLFSGQPVAKRGRPEGAILKAARLLPAYGWRTVEARKKMLARAYKIAGLSSDVKAAVKKAGLDNNQSALLAIASATEAEGQLQKLSRLLKKVEKVAEVQSPPLQPAKGSLGSEDEESDGHAQNGGVGEDKDDDGEAPNLEQESREISEGDDGIAVTEVPPDTDFKQLREFWKEHGGITLWAYTPSTVRKEFVDWLTIRRCRADSDIEPYVRVVFAGRDQIEARVLRAHAIAKGFSKKQVQRYLRSHGYRRERAGRFTPWVYKNADPNFRGKLSDVSQKMLEAPYKAEEAAKDRAIAKRTPSNLINSADPNNYFNEE